MKADTEKHVFVMADRRQLAFRATMLGTGVAAAAVGLNYSVTVAPGREDPFRWYGPDGLSVTALVVGSLLAIHSAFGLLVDTSILPRLIVRDVGFARGLRPLGRALVEPQLFVESDQQVEVSVAAKRREGAIMPGFRVEVTLTCGGHSCRFAIVTADPDRATTDLVAGLERAGVRAVFSGYDRSPH